MDGYQEYILIIIGILSSFGTYKTFVFILEKFIQKYEFVKKVFLGNEYLNGIWIGYYYGASGEIRYLVEYIEQDLDSIVIRGHAYDKYKNLHSSWTSTSVNIEGKTGKLYYTYSVKSIKEKFNNIGCAEFDFERKKQNKFPTFMHGISTDIQIGVRIKTYQIKLLDKKLLKSGNEVAFINKAEDIFKIFKAELEVKP